MRLRLSKSEVIRGVGRFSEIIRNGKRLRAGHLECSYRKSRRDEGASGPRIMIGFAVGRQIRRAVDRNRVKRLMREAYRANKPSIEGEYPTGEFSVELIVHFPGRNVRFSAMPSYEEVAGDLRLILLRVKPLLVPVA